MQYISDEEYKIISRYLFLSLAIKTLQGDLMKIHNEQVFRISDPYIRLLESAIEMAKEERQVLKITMRDHGLKVERSGQRRDFTVYTYFVNNKEEKRSYYNPAIRKKVLTIIEDLFESVDLKGKRPTEV
ncbi:hypothetical protein [Gracilibacillus alcaliphilus]|uniref:hypothetical protein n=1 Tax=Gracilibacillus alcaliphilus TaxID=1401441 RepID=UPI00195B7D50|nr:hypothetical protein [Gracilibacillus alcaliphilus]MBM7678364.1 hypothetical protein [Gracilibacillus alcaliphilus]